MLQDVGSAQHARCVVLTQEHRGHGVSTAAYYLSRVLVAQGLRVLLVDLTGRKGRLNSLVSQAPVKNLVFWAPVITRPQDVRTILDQAKQQTAGKCDVMLLDMDASLLERAGGFTLGVDYIVTIAQSTPNGQTGADRMAERLHDELPPHGRVGIVFSRVDAPTAADLPERTTIRSLPVIGYYPADYLLAGGDAYSLKGDEPSFPHDTYLFALMRLGQKLRQLVPLNRIGGLVHVDSTPPPYEADNPPTM